MYDHPLKQWPAGKKGASGNTKIWIPWEQKEILDDTKLSFLIIQGQKNENWQTQALTECSTNKELVD